MNIDKIPETCYNHICKNKNTWGRPGFDGDVESEVASRCDQST